MNEHCHPIFRKLLADFAATTILAPKEFAVSHDLSEEARQSLTDDRNAEHRQDARERRMQEDQE